MKKNLIVAVALALTLGMLALGATACSSSPSTTTSPTTATPPPTTTTTQPPTTTTPPPTTTTTPPPTTTTAPPTTTTPPPTTTTAPPGQPLTIDLIAKNIAFDKSTITVPAGAQVTVNFDNQDSGTPHNLAVYANSSATTSIFVGAIITGPNVITYTFTAPSTPGTYFFRCDVHPTSMTGDFVVQ